ncbi:E3 ubiquitin-protein ligase PPP1R11 isoform X2 [Panulirus ornatus]|uniref:E3 ubiquitin-protein ligase PPP1R11 isoform X2 n=1 Tax=Panulirus ornatus TaxID=150431 RepID=UPI003A878333
MATSIPNNVTGSSSTVVEPESPHLGAEEQVSSGVVRLKLHKPRTKKVSWTNDTIDNENMGKKKSKCCCVYVKPHELNESSSDSEDECEHCSGHVEKKKKNQPHLEESQGNGGVWEWGTEHPSLL